VNLWPPYQRQTEPELTDDYPPQPPTPFEDWGLFSSEPGCYHEPAVDAFRYTEYQYDGRREEE